MVMVTVTANSRNRRPTIPLISSNGMNTATSEMLMERCEADLLGALHGGSYG